MPLVRRYAEGEVMRRLEQLCAGFFDGLHCKPFGNLSDDDYCRGYAAGWVSRACPYLALFFVAYANGR